MMRDASSARILVAPGGPHMEMIRPLRCVTLAATLSLAACASPRASSEPWVYAFSREFYPALCDDGELAAAFARDPQTGCGALVVLCVFALPFAVDTVLLPVTVPHDLLARR